MKPGRGGRRRPERGRLRVDQNLAGMFWTTGDGRILEANESFAHTLGHTAPAELRGRHLGEFYVDPARWDRLLAGLRVARTVANLEVALRRSNGSVVWVLMSVVRGGEDPSAGIEGSIVDITARKRADDLLRETEALRSVAALATAAAHEINNSLNVLKGNLQLLSPRVDGELVAAHLTPALDAAKAIEEIVGRMNRIMRLELAEQCASLPEMLDLRKSAAAPSAPGPDASLTG
jgi:PAS domain S-box-containing protein